ncbi:MAG: hypothetical protein IPG71_07225 [bacterium]|nr:hypothetical protein [bacterium]
MDCSNAPTLFCSERGEITAGQMIPPGTGATDRYCCSDLEYTGRKLVYRLTVPEQTNLRLYIYDEHSIPLTMFLLSACDQQSCLASAQGILTMTGLPGQDYYLVVESSDTLGHEFEVFAQCYGDCIGETCVMDIRGPGGMGNRYLDGEGNGTGTELYYSYYPGFGTTQTILRYDAACDSLPAISWQSQESSAARMLAYDPRNGGEFWCGTTTDYFSGTGRLYRISSGGGVVQSWNYLTGLPILRWSGAAFDAVHNHLWVMIRDSLNLGNSRAYELNVSNPQQPVVIQGPHVLLHDSPNSAQSSGGADYADSTQHLLVMFQGLPDDFVQCYNDVEPAYSGPPPGPGLAASEWCGPDSNGVQGYGLAAREAAGGGEIVMMNFTDSDWQHPLERYPAPCRLVPFHCVPPDDVSISATETAIELHWTAIEPGVYDVYSSQAPENDGNPDGGQDHLFHLETTLTLAPGPVVWIDADLAAVFKTYTVLLNCSSGVGQNSQFGQRLESESRKEENGHAD